MADFRFPNINAPTDSGRLKQIETYLFQLTNQLNYAIKSADEIEAGRTDVVVPANNGEQQLSAEDKKKADTFYAIKDLIINSADIVNAYYEEINTKLSGEYVAQSQFGNYVEKDDATYKETSQYASASFEKVQAIGDVVDPVSGTIEGISMYRRDNFYIKTGWLGEKDKNGNEIGGIEIGRTKDDGTGEETDLKFARFTPERLEFFLDKYEEPIAYMSGLELVITNAKISGYLKLGGYQLETSDGIAFKWIG